MIGAGQHVKKQDFETVYFDFEVYSFQNYGGISRYFSTLCKLLPAQGWKPITVAGLHMNQYLRDAEKVMGVWTPGVAHTVRGRLLLNGMIQWPILRLCRPMVLHKTYYGRHSYPKGCRTVVTVHDLIPELGYVQDDRLAANKKHACEKADHIIAVSYTTKTDLIRLTGLPSESVSVIHLAAGIEPCERAPSRNVSERPYLLYVGNRRLYKSFNVLLSAYSTSERLRADYDLILFGGEPLTAHEMQEFRRLEISARVRRIHGNDRLLAAVYQEARALIITSLYEGFGLPALEAMRLRCPVVASDIPATREVAEEVAAYYAPGQPDDLRMVLERVLYDDDELSRMREAGAVRSLAFSWRSTAEQTAAVYRHLGFPA